MADTLFMRVKNAWNVFRYGDQYLTDLGFGTGERGSRRHRYGSAERTLIPSIYNRIGIDSSSIGFKHVKVDENGYFQDVVKSHLNECLTLDANIDQTARHFIQDVVESMCSEGVVAIVPVDTTHKSGDNSYDIITMRTGRITQWFPDRVQVNLYDQRLGIFRDVILKKNQVAIVENPLYPVMNEPNSTLKRLQEKLNLLDYIDLQSGNGRLDVIIRVPYTIKGDAKQALADRRKAAIEAQLKDSQYGIAYIDGTEDVIQLNRPAENNLMTQIEYLTRMLFSQLGMTEEVFNGTADEKTMINYYNRTIEPILGAVCDSMTRTFLTKTARTQGQTIMAFRDPFKMVDATNLAELADKFTRNEIFTSNEFRGRLGVKPSSDPRANELRNKNLNEKVQPTDDPKMDEKNQNGRSLVKDE